MFYLYIFKCMLLFRHLSTAMLFLLSNVRSRDQRTNAFVSIGLVTIAIGDHMKPYFTKILDAIKLCLPPKVLL